MSFEENSFSNLILTRAKSPKFTRFNNLVEGDSLTLYNGKTEQGIEFKIEGESLNGLLTSLVVFWDIDLSNPFVEIGVLDILVELFRKVQRRVPIAKITWREAENFMRDRNDQKAWQGKAPISESEFKEIQAAVIAFISYAQVAKNLKSDSKKRFMDFEKINIMTKISLLEEFLKEVIRPILQSDGGDLRLVELHNEGLVLDFLGECSQCLGRQATLIFIKKIFQEHFPMLKVVALGSNPS